MCDQGSLVGLCVQDYKSLCAVVTIVPPWLTTRQTDRRRHACIHDRRAKDVFTSSWCVTHLKQIKSRLPLLVTCRTTTKSTGPTRHGTQHVSYVGKCSCRDSSRCALSSDYTTFHQYILLTRQ